MYKLFLFVAVVANVILLVSAECRKCKKNEVYSDCTNGGCDARNCTQLGYAVPCVKIDPKCCKKGCVCAEGYLRDERGNCIPKNQCPSCGGDPNATSGCGVFCNRCQGPVPCPKICKINACDCKVGYVYDEITKKCVLPGNCTPICKKNEVLSNCTNGGCDARNCSQLGYAVPCVKIDPKYCKKGCVCAEGYLRADNGTCIPKQDCPSCGGDCNAKSGCGVFCNRCQGPVPCPKICKVNGCDCKDGYVYDEITKKCVLPKNCTPICKKNEVLSNCTNGGCDARNCSQLGYAVPCVKIDPKDCKKGCVCAEGYLRADNGTCIPKKDCPSCGGDCNAKSGCGVFCNRCQGPVPCPKICKVNGCDCKDGYVYDEITKKCVLPKNCTPICKKNEVLSNCTNGGCDARNCSQLGYAVPCVKIDPKYCKKGCVCAEGYLRADNGTCIPKKDCPSCGGDCNAKSGCGVFCNRCQGPVPCIKICYNNACDCKDGYVYDEITKKCVLPKNCPPICKKNEVLSNCTNGGCDARNCSQLGYAVPCVKIDPKDCKKGCVCAEGYLRADNGTCIPKKDCPSCGGDCNAKSGCGLFCNRCQGPVPCPRICEINACDCKDGYVYDESIKKCVLSGNCPPKCKINEMYSTCMNSQTLPTNCSQLGTPIPAQGPTACIKGCKCIDNYVRADNGTCIPILECPSCGGDPNAESGCSVFCTRCSNYKSGNIACPASCQLNGCECRKGYIYDDVTKKCVLPEKCTPVCKPNESIGCTNEGCSVMKCSDIGKEFLCVDIAPGTCKKGCVCAIGYLRADNGTCIPKDQCPPNCPPHEVHSDCSNVICDAKTCDELGKPIACPKISKDGCIKGCVCEGGYVRAENGTCIPKTSCPSCNGDPNAGPGCGGFCTRCDNYDLGPIPCPPMCILNGCECKKGFIYDQNIKKCVQPEDCTETCEDNEVYSECTNSGCSARNCSQVGSQVRCEWPEPDDCEPGCVCKDGFLRADNGTCVPSDQCPSCGGDTNAVDGCGVFCTRCSNYKKGPIACPEFCKIGGCECKKGYIYDDVTKKCVLPSDCSPICKENEVNTGCINGRCGHTKCSELGGPILCVDPPPGGCIKGCLCAKGYLRDDNGTCVREEDCPCGGDPNAKPGCSRFCTRCSNYEQGPVACTLPCKLGGCECRDGYIYDDVSKKCVLPKDCTPTCKDNEVYSNCTNGGCIPQKCSQLGKPVLPCISMTSVNCTKGCVCASGYLRADNGTCIPTSECPSCNDDPNAEQGCGSFCDRCSNYNQKHSCPIGCILNGCQCRKGFIYDQNIKKCVLPEQCTPTCKTNEVYSNCTNGGCTAKNCSQLGIPIACAPYDKTTCLKGCICAPGYLRADNGTCVPTSECPPSCHNGAVYDSCANQICRFQNCSQYGYPPLFCRAINETNCKGGCICPVNYLRNANGICIPQEECPEASCNGDKNAKSGCGVHCGNTCSDYNSTKPIACPAICYLDACDCKPGFVYDENTKLCVKPEECTIPQCRKANEEYTICPPKCPFRTCGIDDDLIDCIPQPSPGDPKCPKPSCRCKAQFFRDDKGNCVPRDKCPTCTGQNEEYDPCFSPCSAGRCNFDPTTVKCIPPPSLGDPGCVAGCRCKDGYVRNDQSVCILEKDCPPKCKANEVISNCTNGGCIAQNCSQLGKPVPCVNLIEGACKKGCICASGYLRDENGVCVPVSQCPSCNDDPNAELGCGTFCDRCSNYNQKHSCPIGCIRNGCQCKKGFIYDQNTKKCVLPEQCTPTCKTNEVYSDCTNGGCSARNCSQLGKPVPCIKMDPSACIKGCVCATGYLRADNGTCIPTSQCPSCNDDPNAEPGCGTFCERCSNINQTHGCPLGCILNGCQCKKGYIYDQNTLKCVLPSQCTPTCQDTEDFSTCANGICRLQNCTQYGAPIPFCPKFDTSKCKPGCICKTSYLRDCQGYCIPQDDCPEAKTTTPAPTTTTEEPTCYEEDDSGDE